MLTKNKECRTMQTVKSRRQLEVIDRLRAMGIAGDYDTALMLAASEGHLEVVELLLNTWAYAFKNAEDSNGNTALMLAASEGHLEVVELLLKVGANKEATDNDGQTALILAASKGHLEVVKMLLKAGAKVDATSIKGATALIFAATEGHAETVDILLKAGAKKEARDSDGNTALMCAVERGHVAVVEMLLKAGANKEAVTYDGDTALISAASEGHVAVVELLLEYRAELEATSFECTALMMAASAGHTAVVELLLKAGANKEATDYDGDTALIRAAYRCHAAVVEVLLRAGAEVDAMGDECKTALCWAIHSSNDVESSQKENTMKALISYGANPFLRVGNHFVNHDPVNPLADYSEDILNYIALSDHAEGFCAAAGTDSPEVKAIKANMSKRCSRMNALRSIYMQELDCYQATWALNTTARSIHPSYSQALNNQQNGVGPQPQTKQRSDDALRRNLRDRALSIVTLNMFLPIRVDSADDTNEKRSDSEARARFFSSIRERMAAKYQAALVEKQLVPAGDIVEFTAIESEAALQKIEASINQQAQLKDAMNLAP